jgi:cell division initiation protein
VSISPINIKKQEFNKSFRGYNKEEVQAFLEKLADEFEAIQKENEEIKAELDQANIRLSEFRRIETSLQDNLLKAQESASKSIESSKKQTSLMIKEAEIKASQIVDKAREQANELRTAVINLKEEKDLMISKLKSIINSQAHLLEIRVTEAGEEAPGLKKLEQEKKVELDVNEVVNKLL